MKENKYRKDIQTLRGIALLAVLVFHASEELFPNGYLGVDIFFCISGFVVTPLIMRALDVGNENYTYQRWPALMHFYIRRFYRLVPALTVSLIFSVLIMTLFGNPTDHQRFARQGIATMFLVGNIGAYRYSGDYFSPTPNPLVHTWSLSVEEQIFILLPVVVMSVFLTQKITKVKFEYTLIFLTILSFVLFLNPIILEPVYLNIGSNYSNLTFNFYSPFERIWQFTVGGLIFLYVGKEKQRLRILPKWASQVIVLAITLIIFLNLPISNEFGSFLAIFFSATLIYYRSLIFCPSSINRILVWLGDRSYSIYLFHMPILYIAKFSAAIELGQEKNRIIHTIIGLLLSILFGTISYSKIEVRFRNQGSFDRINFTVASKLAIFVVIIPVSLFLGLDRATDNRYWGLDRSLKQPSAPWLSDPNCDRMSYQDKPCVYEKFSTDKKVLLIGDSHAAHISQALIDAGELSSWNVAIWTGSGCQVRFKQKLDGHLEGMCLNQNREILNWVRDSNPEAIVISQYVYANSNLSELQDAFLLLKSVVPKILLVENNPIFPDAEEFMVSKPLIMAPYNPPKSFPENRMDLTAQKASNEMSEWARANGISTLSLKPLFCKKGICTRYENGQWMYRDADHLSVAGASKAILELTKFLKN